MKKVIVLIAFLCLFPFCACQKESIDFSKYESVPHLEAFPSGGRIQKEILIENTWGAPTISIYRIKGVPMEHYVLGKHVSAIDGTSYQVYKNEEFNGNVFEMYTVNSVLFYKSKIYSGDKVTIDVETSTTDSKLIEEILYSINSSEKESVSFDEATGFKNLGNIRLEFNENALAWVAQVYQSNKQYYIMLDVEDELKYQILSDEWQEFFTSFFNNSKMSAN